VRKIAWRRERKSVKLDASPGIIPRIFLAQKKCHHRGALPRIAWRFAARHLSRKEIAMTKMRAVQITGAKGRFELVERDMPEPRGRDVRVRVQACGVCHSDAITKEGIFPGIRYPIVPGHEIAGVIDAVGADVPPQWKVGRRVGVGWFGGHCGYCEPCRRDDMMDCRNLRIPGISYDGGYAEAVIAPYDALAAIPDDLSPEDAAPLLCAGVTTYNALRRSGAMPGDLVAIHGIGGLGHLGVQFAARMGFRVAAIGRGRDKAGMARELGAHVYIDSAAQNVAEALQALGGASVVIATVPNGPAMSGVIDGLGVRGKLMVIGVSAEPITVTPFQLISASRTIAGHAAGTSQDSEDTMQFSTLAHVRPMIETMPLERAAEAYERMMSGKAKFRMVLVTGR
jgi:D-arabinose 1-dehydrogenase-like Zn-dependent alcohol dehydrogenase